MSDSGHEKLVAFSRGDYEPLMRELIAMRLAVYARRPSTAAEMFRSWRRRLMRHLAWEERSVLPAFAARRAGVDHEERHRVLLGHVAELGELLRPGRGPTWEPAVLAALEQVERKVAEHRDREVHSVCAELDETLPEVTIDRIERELYDL